MDAYQRSLEVINDLFGRDHPLTLATTDSKRPTIRMVDAYYAQEAFWIVTYALSQKVRDIAVNPHVALCDHFHVFTGKAYNVGHPLLPVNSAIRAKLMEVYAPWYFKHNNEDDPNMCFVKVELATGFIHKDGIGYRVDFVQRSAEEIPFTPDVSLL